jgi:hypothetical protein
MTRVVVDPDELVRVAGQVEEAGRAYLEAGRGVTDQVLPAMPQQVAEAIAAGLASAGARLEELSTRLDAQAYLLRTRAAIIENETASQLLLNVGNADE